MPSSIEDEQTFIDRAHSLDEHIDHLRSRISNTTNAPSTGTGQDELEREALLDNLRLQLHAAEAARPECASGDCDSTGDDHHIGRIGMRDEAGDILLIDWRAPKPRRSIRPQTRIQWMSCCGGASPHVPHRRPARYSRG